MSNNTFRTATSQSQYAGKSLVNYGFEDQPRKVVFLDTLRKICICGEILVLLQWI